MSLASVSMRLRHSFGFGSEFGCSGAECIVCHGHPESIVRGIDGRHQRGEGLAPYSSAAHIAT
jgi:hypothetical protein